MPQNCDITHMSGEGMEETLRVDTWNGDNDHWLYYFEKQTDLMGYKLVKGATTVRQGREELDEEGLDTAKEAVRQSDYVLVS
jgi:hypothetical protein